MDRLPRLCQVYSLALLLTATVLSSPPYLILALFLLFATLVLARRPAPARYNIAASISLIVFLPLVFATILSRMTAFPVIAIEITATALAAPLIHLLDYYLKQNAPQSRPVPAADTRRRVTPVYRVLLSFTLSILAMGVLIDMRVLLTTGIMLSFYLLGITLRIFFTVPRGPLAPAPVTLRVISGAAAESTLEIASRTKAMIYAALQPADDWLEITPQYFTLHGNTAKLNLKLTPPLAGPVRPRLSAAVVDARGLVQVGQLLEPLELHVIPQARYAEWLARKYLEQTRAGAAPATASPQQDFVLPSRGIEYLSSRTYQPGDPLQGIDWKHTMKLQQFIVREFAEAGEPPAIIAVNLSVTDAEAADKLAFNLLAAALTLAREHIPAALTAYNQQEVLLTTAITEPDEILKRVLTLTKDISIIENPRQYLDAPDMNRLRKSISELKRVESESAQRLLAMLNFERQAIENTSRDHPATTALTLATKQVPAPAVILLVSQLNHDVEAILVNSEKLARRNYKVVPVKTAG